MTATGRVDQLIAEVRAAGGKMRRDGDAIELAAPAALPRDLVERIRAAKPLLLDALSEASKWRARHREALRHWGALHFAEEAARIAWGEMENRWHRLHGEPIAEAQCAGCGAPIGGRKALTLGDGDRVHLDALDCLIRYGARWRGKAREALTAMGWRRQPERMRNRCVHGAAR